MILQNPDIIAIFTGIVTSIIGVGWRFSTRIARLETEIEYLRHDVRRILEGMVK